MNDIERITRKYIADHHLNDLARLGDTIGWAEHIDNIYTELGERYFKGGMPARMDKVDEIAEVFTKVCAEQEAEQK